MSAATTDPMSAVLDEELKHWWAKELDDFQRSALSAAFEVAEDGAVMEIHQKKSSFTSAWLSLSDATKEEALSRHFNEALDSIMSLQPALPSTDGSFRGIDRPDYEVITAGYLTKKSTRKIRSKATTKDVSFPCPSTFTGADYVRNQHDGLGRRPPKFMWPRQVRQECDRFDSTRMMAIMALNCSSLDEASGIASSEHCPSGFKDDKTGFTSLYILLHDDILPKVNGASPWDTTRNRQPRPLSTQSGEIMRKSAMRITRQHFDDMGLSHLPQTLAIDKHLAMKGSEGDIGQSSDRSGVQVSFVPTQSPTSTNAASKKTSKWSSWVPSWLSRSKPTTGPKPTTTGAGVDSTTVPTVSRPTSSPSTQNPAQGAPFRRVSRSLPSGDSAPINSSFQSENSQPKQVRFDGTAPGAHEGASTATRKRSGLSWFFGSGNKNGKMVSSRPSSSCRTATGTGFTPTPSALMV